MSEMAGHVPSGAPVHHAGAGMGKKLGPLPVWAWGTILGGGAVVFLYMHNSANAAASAAPVAQDSSLLPEVSGDPLGSSSGGGGSATTDAGTEQEFSSIYDQLDALTSTAADQADTITAQSDTIDAQGAGLSKALAANKNQQIRLLNKGKKDTAQNKQIKTLTKKVHALQVHPHAGKAVHHVTHKKKRKPVVHKAVRH
jgi:hypothetical protein